MDAENHRASHRIDAKGCRGVDCGQPSMFGRRAEPCGGPNRRERTNKSRADRIRTCDLLTPSQTRYQSAPRPDILCHQHSGAGSSVATPEQAWSGLLGGRSTEAGQCHGSVRTRILRIRRIAAADWLACWQGFSPPPCCGRGIASPLPFWASGYYTTGPLLPVSAVLR